MPAEAFFEDHVRAAFSSTAVVIEKEVQISADTIKSVLSKVRDGKS